MSQRYEQPLTSQARGVSDLSLVPAETDHRAASLSGAPLSSDSLPLDSLPPDFLSSEDAAWKAAAFAADGGVLEADSGALVRSHAVLAASRGRGAAVTRPDFYGRGTRHAARRGWLAWAFLDVYSWRAILLMLSFLAFGLVVSSFVLSL